MKLPIGLRRFKKTTNAFFAKHLLFYFLKCHNWSFDSFTHDTVRQVVFSLFYSLELSNCIEQWWKNNAKYLTLNIWQLSLSHKNIQYIAVSIQYINAIAVALILFAISSKYIKGVSYSTCPSLKQYICSQYTVSFLPLAKEFNF